MKTRVSIILVLAIFGLLFQPVPVQATAPVPLTIEAIMGFTGPASAAGDFFLTYGLFSETGSFSDTGSATEEFFIDMDEGTIHGVKTLEGELGTITIKFQARLAYDFSSASGHFVIISGTGAYERLHGVGTTEALIADGHIYAEYEGTAHFD